MYEVKLTLRAGGVQTEICELPEDAADWCVTATQSRQVSLVEVFRLHRNGTSERLVREEVA